MFKWLTGGAKESVETAAAVDRSSPLAESLPERPHSAGNEIAEALATAQPGSSPLSLTEAPGGNELMYFRGADPDYIQGPHARLAKVSEADGKLRFSLEDLTKDGAGVVVSRDGGATWSPLPDGGKSPIEVASGDLVRVGAAEIEIPSVEPDRPWRLAALDRIEVLERDAPKSAELRDALYDFAMRDLRESGPGSTQAYERARMPLEKALAVAEKLDDAAKTIEITRQLGMIELRTGNGQRAQELLEGAERMENREALLSEARAISDRLRPVTD